MKAIGHSEIARGAARNGTQATDCIFTVPATFNGTSQNLRAPSTNFRFGRAVYLITQAELAASGYGGGASPQSIGWIYNVGGGVAGSAPLVVYMENTSDVTNTKSTTWTTAISTMTTVHNAVTAVPAAAGPFDVTFTGGSPFTYTGGGLYVAFDWGQYTGTLTSGMVIVQCNIDLAGGLLGGQSNLAAPATLTASNFRPLTRLASNLQNDVSVDLIYSLGSLPLGFAGPQTVQAVVTNRGAADQTNVDVTLDITGAQSFTDTQQVAFLGGCGGQAIVTFDAWTPAVLGDDDVTVSIGPDDSNANNSRTKPVSVTAPTYSYKHPGTTPDGGFGIIGITAVFLAKLTITRATAITQVTPEFVGPGTDTFRVCIYDDNGSGFPGAQLYLDAVNRVFVGTGSATITLPSPVPTGPGNVFVGVQQTTTNAISLSYDNEFPIRVGSFFIEAPIGTGFFEENADGDNFKFNIGATLDRCDATLVAGSNSPICPGATLQLTAFADSGLTYSWTGPNGFTSGQQNPTIPDAATDASGTYTVFVNGCLTGVSTNVTVGGEGCPVAVTVTRLDAEAVDAGIRIQWAFSEPRAFAKVVIERSVSEQGPWSEVAADVSDDAGVTAATDRSAEAGRTYYYRLIGMSASGSRAVFGPVRGTSGAPREFAMSAVWPNPSLGPLAITFSVPLAADIRMTVVDLQGRQIAQLAKGAYAPGVYQVSWDGRTDRGPVATGLYFVHFVTPEKDFNQRVTIAR